MEKKQAILTDQFKRKHTYLRISLTERCNLRCTYCMPAEGVPLSHKSHIMNYDEIYEIAKTFVANGVTKIRLTGGEPLIRKDIPVILGKLASLPVELAITTNGITIDRHIDDLKKFNINNINVSLDTLSESKFKTITRRNQFEKVYQNILLLVEKGFNVKINAVLIKGFNDDEIIDFINLTKDLLISFRFIEFMPFDGNKWDLKKMVSLAKILDKVTTHFTEENVERIKDAENDTSKN
jgi:molybdenum cofactor biosynthesis enzyme MoaA